MTNKAKKARRVPLTDDSQFDLVCRLESVRDGVVIAREALWQHPKKALAQIDACHVPGVLTLVIEQLERIEEIISGLNVAVDPPKTVQPSAPSSGEGKGLRLVHDSTQQ